MTLMRTNYKYILYTMILELILVFLNFKYQTLAEPLSYFISSKKVQYNTSGILLTFLFTCPWGERRNDPFDPCTPWSCSINNHIRTQYRIINFSRVHNAEFRRAVLKHRTNACIVILSKIKFSSAFRTNTRRTRHTHTPIRTH